METRAELRDSPRGSIRAQEGGALWTPAELCGAEESCWPAADVRAIVGCLRGHQAKSWSGVRAQRQGCLPGRPGPRRPALGRPGNAMLVQLMVTGRPKGALLIQFSAFFQQQALI